MKKVLNFAVIAFLVFYVVTQPHQAANVVTQIGHWLQHIAIGMGNFVSNLT
jgi:large-conductance mechanosensitive channel